MSTPRKTYRVVCYDTAHNVLTSDLIEAESDAEAIAIVEALDFCTKWELWEGARLITQLEARQQRA